MSINLWGQVMQDADSYKGTQSYGGPLLFLLMMRRLQVNSMLVVDSLQNKLKTLRIDDYKGEDVGELCGHIKAIIRRLRTLERHNENGIVVTTLPEDLGKTLIQLFQTSSDAKFNQIFRQKELAAFEESLTRGNAAYGDPETILNLAFRIYTNIYSSEEGWTGQFTKANESVFITAGQSKSKSPICFNCGEQHLEADCPHPKNEDRIKANRKSFWDARKKARKAEATNKSNQKKRNNKWPAAPTDRNHKPKKIGDFYYFYHFKSQKWIKCKNQQQAMNQASGNVVTPTTAPPSVVSPNDTQSASTMTNTTTPATRAATAKFIEAMNKNVANYASELGI